jgi:hypothetical protein
MKFFDEGGRKQDYLLKMFSHTSEALDRGFRSLDPYRLPVRARALEGLRHLGCCLVIWLASGGCISGGDRGSVRQLLLQIADPDAPRPLVVEDDIHEGTVNLQAAVILNEAQLPKLVHKRTNP